MLGDLESPTTVTWEIIPAQPVAFSGTITATSIGYYSGVIVTFTIDAGKAANIPPGPPPSWRWVFPYPVTPASIIKFAPYEGWVLRQYQLRRLFHLRLMIASFMSLAVALHESPTQPIPLGPASPRGPYRLLSSKKGRRGSADRDRSGNRLEPDQGALRKQHPLGVVQASKERSGSAYEGLTTGGSFRPLAVYWVRTKVEGVQLIMPKQ